MVAALGNPGSGKVSECPGVQLSPAPYAEASAGPLRERPATLFVDGTKRNTVPGLSKTVSQEAN